MHFSTLALILGAGFNSSHYRQHDYRNLHTEGLTQPLDHQHDQAIFLADAIEARQPLELAGSFDVVDVESDDHDEHLIDEESRADADADSDGGADADTGVSEEKEHLELDGSVDVVDVESDEHEYEIDEDSHEDIDADTDVSEEKKPSRSPQVKESTKATKVRQPSERLFGEFEWRGLGCAFTKSLIRLYGCGVSVRIPWSSFFLNYDARTYLPSVASSWGVYYPWETAINFSVSIPLYVVMRGLFTKLREVDGKPCSWTESLRTNMIPPNELSGRRVGAALSFRYHLDKGLRISVMPYHNMLFWQWIIDACVLVTSVIPSILMYLASFSQRFEHSLEEFATNNIVNTGTDDVSVDKAVKELVEAKRNNESEDTTVEATIGLQEAIDMEADYYVDMVGDLSDHPDSKGVKSRPVESGKKKRKFKSPIYDLREAMETERQHMKMTKKGKWVRSRKGKRRALNTWYRGVTQTVQTKRPAVGVRFGYSGHVVHEPNARYWKLLEENPTEYTSPLMKFLGERTSPSVSVYFDCRHLKPFKRQLLGAVDSVKKWVRHKQMAFIEYIVGEEEAEEFRIEIIEKVDKNDKDQDKERKKSSKSEKTNSSEKSAKKSEKVDRAESLDDEIVYTEEILDDDETVYTEEILGDEEIDGLDVDKEDEVEETEEELEDTIVEKKRPKVKVRSKVKAKELAST